MSHRRVSSLLLVPVCLLALVAGLVVAPADAATPTGVISGTALSSTGKPLDKIRVRLFHVQSDGSWTYLRVITATSRGYYEADELAAGSYVLQFVDTRPTYDSTKHVTTDVKATLAEGANLTKDAFMPVGAGLWGKAWRNRTGKAPSTLIRAISKSNGTVYSSRSDANGGYYLGGLPRGEYTVFAYDHAQAWTTGGRNVRLTRYGSSTKVTFPMNTRAGQYTGQIRAGGKWISTPTYVTAVNRKSGQYWVVKVYSGNLVSLRGLAPGSYKLIVPGVDRYLGRRFNLPKINAGRTTKAGFVDLTRQGGTLTGTLVDAGTGKPLPGVEVTINDKYGHPFETVRTKANGFFDVGGSIPNGDNPVTLTLRARNPIDDVRYQEATKGPYTISEGTVVGLGTITMTPVPAPTPTATTTAPPTP